MICTKLFSYRRKSFHYIWTTESKNFVLFWKEISLYYNWKLPERNLMVCTKLSSLRQRFSHFIWTIEGKNFYDFITYPQYYWKVSITLRGCLEKFFIVFGNFCCKTSYFTQKKNALTYIGHLKVGFTRFLRKNCLKFFNNRKQKGSLNPSRLPYLLIYIIWIYCLLNFLIIRKQNSLILYTKQSES